MSKNGLIIFLFAWLLGTFVHVQAQELDARITINHQQVQGTSTAVFERLKESLTEFINDRQWTNLQFRRSERISCSFNFTIQKYDETDNRMEAALTVSATRPVFNASYTTTTFSTRDGYCNFRFQEFDKLEFRPDNIDNDLTAIVAYYVYLIIGIDLDTMSPKGGTDALQMALNICNNAQSLVLSARGWKAFDDGKNRHAIISDYLDGGMEPFRMMHYKYYREGLDVMAENAERGRAAITEAFELLAKARDNKTMSMLPQLLTEYKADEIVNIYRGKATQKEKDFLIELLGKINASKNSSWNRLRN